MNGPDLRDVLSLRRLSKTVSLSQPVTIGYAGLILMLFALISWAVAVPLVESTIANGTVRVSTPRQTVSHVDGGKIEELLVDEGDVVVPGQALLRLDAEDLESQLDVLRYQLFALQANVDRLQAERDGTHEIVFRKSLLDQVLKNPSMEHFLEGEKRAFESRKVAYDAKIALLKESAKQARDQRASLVKQRNSVDRQLKIVRQQAHDANSLLNKGYGTRNRAVSLERDVEQLIARRLELEAALSDLESMIVNVDQQEALHHAELIDSVESNILANDREIADVNGRIRALKRKFEARLVRSTINGVVIDLRDLSTSDVVLTAAPLIDIIPTHSATFVEAHLPPDKIDGVVEGLRVEVRFPAMATADSLGIEGYLTFVSADVLEDSDIPQAYYSLHIKLDEWPQNDRQIKIIPGMPAEVLIKKSKRTLLEYLLAPLADHAARAFAI
jgi:HlyD family secretion protein